MISFKPHISASKPTTALLAVFVLASFVISAVPATRLHSQVPHLALIGIDATASGPVFDPLVAMGSTVDGHTHGAVAQIFTPANVAAMKSANFHAISYRIRTELGVEAWHWNPQGRWSDAARSQGYWTSSDHVNGRITRSYGYRLPRRGSTIDQANEDGYSRLDDGDARTFWKSNPYLDQRYTGEPEEKHPQWVVIDLQAVETIDAIRIRWGVPFATSYEVQYWDGQQPNDADDNSSGTWRTFDLGAVRGPAGSRGGDTTIALTTAPSSSPARTRWIRILLHSSSGHPPPGSHDARDGLGYAIREISLGRMSRGGTLHDLIQHAADPSRQTHMYVSSTDPWHRATDRDSGTEQPGIDLMFSSGITRGLPMLLPVGVLYDTPDNAAALLRYVRRRGYPVPRMELGEEPDGQYVSPDDFAALYMQTAHALHQTDSTVRLGGPSFQSAAIGVMMTWKQHDDSLPWLRHFVDALRARGQLDRDFTFLSFEWYPFDDVCGSTAAQLPQVVPQLRETMQRFSREGLPPNVPVFITEYGYSAFAGRPEVDLAGAILNAESVAEFLSIGGAVTFYYGTEPSSLDRNHDCDSWGDNTLFLSDDTRRILARTATYHAARMLTTAWADSAGGAHTMLRTTVTESGDRNGDMRGDAAHTTPIGAYAVRRPDGRMAVLMLNRDPVNVWHVQLNGSSALSHSVLDLWQLSAAEYKWHPRSAASFAAPNTGPRHTITSGAGLSLPLPPSSVTVIRQR
ncbi:MAG: discoidin domain-containing protein [Gemmatimonadaceae bacterium]